jgi:hypothetical protein
MNVGYVVAKDVVLDYDFPEDCRIKHHGSQSIIQVRLNIKL